MEKDDAVLCHAAHAGVPIHVGGHVKHRSIVLVSTASPDRPNGSMVRYGAMVREALERHGGGEIRVEECSLGPTQAWLTRFPAMLRTLIRYLCIALNARRLLPKREDCILHLLDGSHAYLLGAVKTLRAPLVITVHDMIPALCLRGELGASRPGRMGAWVIRQAAANLARADALVTSSENTRADVIRLVGLEPERVRVVYLPALAKPTTPVAIPSRIETPYVLHVAGNNTFYKNRQGVVDIFRIIHQSEPIQLKMVGAPPDARLLSKVAFSGVKDAIQFLPNVSEEELAALYRGAAFLLFPSLYEGFGWPPLEAMGHGCPVVCSNAGSLPEIAGDAALIAPPDDTAALADHGIRLLRDTDLRQQMVTAGFRRVQSFGIEALAKGLFDAYGAAAVVFESACNHKPLSRKDVR